MLLPRTGKYREYPFLDHLISQPISVFSLDNWQSALRKQYARRDPGANPIGFEPKKINLKYSFEPLEVKDEPRASSFDTPTGESSVPPGGSVDSEQQIFVPPAQSDDGDNSSRPLEGQQSEHIQDSAQTDEGPSELKDWFELPMLTKLDSLNLLTEWQFHNPNRIRSIMKDDDETAQWVSIICCLTVIHRASSCRIRVLISFFGVKQRIEPIGYDSKSNAYWLIGGLSLFSHEDKQTCV
jgi:hypothetical protein